MVEHVQRLTIRVSVRQDVDGSSVLTLERGETTVPTLDVERIRSRLRFVTNSERARAGSSRRPGRKAQFRRRDRPDLTS